MNAGRYLSWDYVGQTLTWAHMAVTDDAIRLLGAGSFTISATDLIGRARELGRALAGVDELVTDPPRPNQLCVLIAYKPHGYKQTQPPAWPQMLALHYADCEVRAVNPNARAKLCMVQGLDFATILATETAAAKARATARGTPPAKGTTALARRKHIAANVAEAARRYGWDHDDAAGAIAQVLIWANALV